MSLYHAGLLLNLIFYLHKHHSLVFIANSGYAEVMFSNSQLNVSLIQIITKRYHIFLYNDGMSCGYQKIVRFLKLYKLVHYATSIMQLLTTFWSQLYFYASNESNGKLNLKTIFGYFNLLEKM